MLDFDNMTPEQARLYRNAHRIAIALYQHNSPQTVKRLAPILNYDERQLTADMQDLAAYISLLEETIKGE